MAMGVSLISLISPSTCRVTTFPLWQYPVIRQGLVHHALQLTILAIEEL